MTVHLLKLAVGVESPEHLAALQKRRLAAEGVLSHRTRNMPKRAAELLDGGSLYWIIRAQVRVRQRVVAVTREEGADGRPFCRLVLDERLVPTELQARRPHQGWRYLEPGDEPRDRRSGLAEGDEPPEAMLAELRALGLL